VQVQIGKPEDAVIDCEQIDLLHDALRARSPAGRPEAGQPVTIDAVAGHQCTPWALSKFHAVIDNMTWRR